MITVLHAFATGCAFLVCLIMLAIHWVETR